MVEHVFRAFLQYRSKNSVNSLIYFESSNFYFKALVEMDGIFGYYILLLSTFLQKNNTIFGILFCFTYLYLRVTLRENCIFNWNICTLTLGQSRFYMKN